VSGGGLDIPAPDPTGSESDTLANQEVKNWPNYDEISSAKRHNQVLVHKTIGYLIPAALVVAFLCFLAMCLVYVWHLLSRPCWRWLAPAELQNIHSIIFSSVVGGAIALIAKTYFADEKDKAN